MLMMRHHDVEDYAALRDMDATDVGVLDEDDRTCLEELGQYLVATDAWQRFAIWLLHKHFEPAPGEVFVERAIPAPRKTTTTPIEPAAFSGHELSTTAIRFDDLVGSGTSVVGMEFAEPADFGETRPLSDDDEEVLSGIAERLQSHGKIGRFGVQLIRNPLGLTEQELLVETCDLAHRTLYCDISERDAMSTDDSIETSWRWRVVEGEAGPSVMRECRASCTRTVAGEGHVLGHDDIESDWEST